MCNHLYIWVPNECLSMDLFCLLSRPWRLWLLCFALKRYLFLQLITSPTAIILQVRHGLPPVPAKLGWNTSFLLLLLSFPPWLQFRFRPIKASSKTSHKRWILNCFQNPATAAWAVPVWLSARASSFWSRRERGKRVCVLFPLNHAHPSIPAFPHLSILPSIQLFFRSLAVMSLYWTKKNK